MSVPVEIPALADATVQYGAAAYFLTTSDDGRPHISHVTVGWVGDDLRVAVGRSGLRNISARPAAALLWSPVVPGGYSLIVDVVARVDDDHALLSPERAVLHRPAPGLDGAAPGGHDCAPI